MSKSSATGRAVSIPSLEYDEVTDVSDEAQSFSQATELLIKSGDKGTATPSAESQVDNKSASKSEHIQEETTRESQEIPRKLATIENMDMDAVEETDFDPELEEKGGAGATPALHDGQLGPSSSSVGDDSSSDLRGAMRDGVEDDDAVEQFGNSGDGDGDGEVDDEDPYHPGPSHAPPPPHLAPTSPHHQGPSHFQMNGSQGDETDEEGGMAETTGIDEMSGHGQPLPLAHPAGEPGGDDDDIDDDDDDGHAPPPEGAYDPADYEHLSVSAEISELFSYITRYTPQAIELEHRLRPYIPDYIPAVGDIDAFIKIPPPDDKPTLVGLEVLDEPSAKQSDPTVLDLQLRALAKHTTAKSVPIKTVENAEKNPKVIEKWVRDISDLHRAKPPPTVHYSKRMPDIDSLMQEWPGEVEELLKEVSLPTAALDVELPAYVDILCAMLDIPVYKSRIQSLHVLFTLYSVFKNSSHFRTLAEDNYIENDDSSAAERMVL
ncbi:intraflagellar transport protein 46 homolog [Macrobrachium nipponense]|uniref:intraflagellar transport protein 46 homolog n=1 Tax=Macrobrachium nipponense TaxID=159736 RepID=UPI0030C7CCBE